MKEHEITVRHVRESHPKISSVRTPDEIARKIFWDADEYGYSEIISVEVDGKLFYTTPSWPPPYVEDPAAFHTVTEEVNS